MANVGKAVRQHLLTVTAVTNLVANRVFPVALPQKKTFPSIVYRRISGSSDEHLAGTTGAGTTRLQVECYHTSYDDGDALAEIVRQAMHKMATTTVSGVEFKDVLLGNRLDGYQPPAHDDEFGYFVFPADFVITHSETAI